MFPTATYYIQTCLGNLKVIGGAERKEVTQQRKKEVHSYSPSTDPARWPVNIIYVQKYKGHSVF